MVLVGVVIAGWLLWTFLVPPLSLAGALAVTTLNGFSGGLAALATDLAWGVSVGLFVGWMRWLRRKRSGAVETVVEAVASPDIVSSVSLGWMYVALHIGAGLLASLVVWLLGLAFPSQILTGDPMLAGLAYLQASGWIAGGGGGSGGGGGNAAFQLVFVLLFLLLVLLPILAGLASALTAISLKGAASGALGAAGKSVGLVLFLVLTRIGGLPRIRGKFWLPLPPTPKPKPPDRRNRNGVDYHLQSWKKSTDADRAHYELRLREEIFGPGWLKRAARQGLGNGALTGLLTGLLVAGTLAMLRGQ